MSAQLRFLSDYIGDRTPRRALTALLLAVHDLDFSDFDRHGFWDPEYRPYSFADGDRVVANVSVFPLPIRLGGRTVAAGGMSSVATLPAYRGRGLFKRLIARALDHCDSRFECVVLWTDKPGLYRPFGFRICAEHYFVGPPPTDPPAPGPMRALSFDRPADVLLICRLLAARTPVSDRLAVCRHDAFFLHHCLLNPDWRLDYLTDHDALVVSERRGQLVRLIDVAAPILPPLGAMLAAIGGETEAIEMYFPPDRLAGNFVPRPGPYPAGDVMMVRGAFDVGDRPAMFPPTVLC